MYLSVMHLCLKAWGGPSAFWVSLTALNSEEITLCSDSVEQGGSICLWVSMTTLNSEEITLLWQCWLGGGPSTFESQWQHWTVKRSLCALTVLTTGGGSICLWVSWQHWTVKRSLCALTVLTGVGGSICLWVSMTTLNSEEITLCSDSVDGGVHLPLSVNDNIEQWRDHSVLWQCWLGGSINLWVSMTTLNSEEITLCYDSVDGGGPSAFECQWQHWTVKRSLCALTVLTGGWVHLPLSVNDNIEQWRDHSVLWQCWLGGGFINLWVSMTTLNSEEITLCSDSVDWGMGPSAFECQWQHWTVKRSLCALTVLTGVSIYLWVSMTTLNSEEITLCSDSVDWGVHLPLSLNDNIEQWRDQYVLWQFWRGWVHLPLSVNDNIEQWRDHSVLWQCWLGGSICLWVSMTTLNSEEITLCSDSVDWGVGPSAFESQWQHWTVKRSLCALTVLTGGSICLWVWMTTLNSEEINLCSDSFEGGGSICLWVSMTTLNSEEITLCSDSVDWGDPSAFECQWQHWTVKRSLCALTVLMGGSICLWVSMTTLNNEEITLCSDSVDQGGWVYLPLSVNDNIEQWRDHSVLWQCWLGGSNYLWVSMTTLNSEEITLCSDSVDWGGPSAFESQWQHWTVKRSLCALTVLTGGGPICLWVSMTTLNSEEITLCSDSVDWGMGPSTFECQWQHWTVKRSLCALTVLTGGVHQPLSLNDNIEQWRDHSVLWQCWLGDGSICLWVSMTTLNSEEITLCSDSVDWGMGPSAFESQWQHWTVKRSLCALTVLKRGSICLWVSMTTLNSEEITLCSDSVDWGMGPSAFESQWQHWTMKRSICALTVLTRGSIYLWVSMTTLNSEEITLCSDSVDWGVGPSAFESQWQHWTVKRSFCALSVLAGGWSICLWVWVTTLNSEEITLCYDSVDWGVHLPLSLSDNIEQWRDHSVLWQCWLGGGSICLWVSMTTLNNEEITLCSDSVDLGGSICLWVSMTTLNSEEITLCSDSVEWGESICLWCLYLYICTGISLYFLISWLFWMGSHLRHWTAKSSLCALAVSNGGSICLWCLYLYICTGISLHFRIIWLFQMGSHLRHWTAKSSLCALAVSNGGEGVPAHFVCKIWSPRHLGVCINKVFSLCKDQWKTILLAYVNCLCHRWNTFLFFQF